MGKWGADGHGLGAPRWALVWGLTGDGPGNGSIMRRVNPHECCASRIAESLVGVFGCWQGPEDTLVKSGTGVHALSLLPSTLSRLGKGRGDM